MVFVADTSFFVDVQRQRPEARTWLDLHPEALLAITSLTWAEFAARNYTNCLAGIGRRAARR